MADRILEVIAKADPEPAHSNAVAKAIGCRNKKEINPTLFDMQRKGLLQKVFPNHFKILLEVSS